MSGNAIIRAFRNIQRRDIVFVDKYLIKTPFHSGFWVKKRLDAAIIGNAGLAHGMMLDVGCGIRPYESCFTPFVKKYLGLEYSPESGYRGNSADLCGDAAALPLDSNSIDTILCTEVFEHLPNPEQAMKEFARVLRPGGVLITTAPFVFPIHDEHDYFRYTPKGLAVMMKRHGLEVEKVEPLSGSGLTIAILFNLYFLDIGFTWTKWLYPFGLVLRPLLLLCCFFVNLAGRLFEIVIPSEHLAFDHLTIARKPNVPPAPGVPQT
jgi:SAM-dependent methyltransferase